VLAVKTAPGYPKELEAFFFDFMIRSRYRSRHVRSTSITASREVRAGLRVVSIQEQRRTIHPSNYYRHQHAKGRERAYRTPAPRLGDKGWNRLEIGSPK